MVRLLYIAERTSGNIDESDEAILARRDVGHHTDRL